MNRRLRKTIEELDRKKAEAESCRLDRKVAEVCGPQVRSRAAEVRAAITADGSMTGPLGRMLDLIEELAGSDDPHDITHAYFMLLLVPPIAARDREIYKFFADKLEEAQRDVFRHAALCTLAAVAKNLGSSP